MEKRAGNNVSCQCAAQDSALVRVFDKQRTGLSQAVSLLTPEPASISDASVHSGQYASEPPKAPAQTMGTPSQALTVKHPCRRG